MDMLNTVSAASNILAQSSNSGGAGFPFIETVIVLAGIAGAVFAVCRSANRR